MRETYLLEYSAKERWRNDPKGEYTTGGQWLGQGGKGSMSRSLTEYDIRKFYLLYRNDSLLYWGRAENYPYHENPDIKEIGDQMMRATKQ